MLAIAVRTLDANPRVFATEDVVLMVYNLGRIDQSIAEVGIEIDQEIARQGDTFQ